MQEARTGAETIGACCLLALSLWLSYKTQGHLPRNGIAHREVCPSPRDFLRSQSEGGNPQLAFLPSRYV